jgi:hypothetical protein
VRPRGRRGGAVEDRLEILPHGAELRRTHVEGVICPLPRRGGAQHDCLAQVFDIEKLVAVVSGASTGKFLPA